MIVLKLNFNFANMIAIPLLFSLGVSYPIYFIKRFDELGDFKKLSSFRSDFIRLTSYINILILFLRYPLLELILSIEGLLFLLSNLINLKNN